MDPQRLTWPDLIIDVDYNPAYVQWLRPWSWLASGRLAARCLNKFGCWFIQRPSGSIELLDVFFGQLELVAESYAEFQALLNEPWWQETYLLSEFVYRLHTAGIVASGTSCYAFAPPPVLSGLDPWSDKALPTSAVTVIDVAVLQDLYAQLHPVAKGSA